MKVETLASQADDWFAFLQGEVTLYLGPVARQGNVFLRFCNVSSNELVVLDSLGNSKQYKNAGKRFHVYGALYNQHNRLFLV